MTFTEYSRKTGAMWLSPKIVAKLMQCSIEHVYDLAKSGRVPYIRDGRNIRFRPEDLVAYEERIFSIRPKKPRRRAHGPFQKARKWFLINLLSFPTVRDKNYKDIIFSMQQTRLQCRKLARSERLRYNYTPVYTRAQDAGNDNALRSLNTRKA